MAEREVGKYVNTYVKLVIYHSVPGIKTRAEPVADRQIPINAGPCCPVKLYWASVSEGGETKGSSCCPRAAEAFYSTVMRITQTVV